MAERRWSVSLESAAHIRDMAANLNRYKNELNDANDVLVSSVASNMYLGPRQDIILDWINRSKRISLDIDEDLEEIAGDLNLYAGRIEEKIKSMKQ